MPSATPLSYASLPGARAAAGLHYVPIDVNLLFGEPTVALRGPWGNDLVEIAPKAKELGRGTVGLPPRLPRQRPPAGLRLPALAAAPRRRADADSVRPRGDRPGAPGQGRAPVLVLLRLQRLEQPARRRLGDDPARLRRPDGRRRPSARRRSRSGTASTRARSGPRGTTRSSSASTARIPSSTRPTARTRTSTGRRCISAAPPRRASAATTRAGRPWTCARRS